MIGNSLSTDVQGAQGVRICAIWINRCGLARDERIVPDREIRSLDVMEIFWCHRLH
jgi:FMN phosphatase YigB (HAD superfamily)